MLHHCKVREPSQSASYTARYQSQLFRVNLRVEVVRFSQVTIDFPPGSTLSGVKKNTCDFPGSMRAAWMAVAGANAT